MRTGTILTCFALVVLMSSVGMSQNAVRESFDYPVGSVLDGLGTAGNGWGGPWQFYTQGNNPPVPDSPVDSSQFVVNDFDYDNIPYEIPHVGNSISATIANANTEIRYSRWLAQRWPDQAGTSYWISAAMQLHEVNTTSIWAFVSFYDSVTATSNGEGTALGKGWGDNVFSFGSGAPGANEKSVYGWDVGSVWLVGRVVMSGDAGNEQFYMWVNPDPSVEPDTALADVRHGGGLNNGFTRIAVHFGDYGGLAGLKFDVDEVRVGTSWGDVSSPLTTAIDRPETQRPELFALPQNYPNPFNPSTNISYTLEKQDKVRLTVYDIRGREVAVLVDGVQAAGEHVVSFSGTGLASGIYFYRLETPKGVLVNKMALVK